MLPRLLNLLLAAWLVVAPAVLDYPDAAARQNDLWLGLAVAISALLAVEAAGFRALTALLGLWLVVWPRLVVLDARAALNDTVVGCAVIVLALQPFPAARRRAAATHARSVRRARGN